MADDPSISYSYQYNTPEAAPPQDQMLYAFTDCDRVPVPNGGVLLIDRDSDQQLVVAAEVSVALHSCREYRTLAQHVDILTTTIPQLAGQAQDVMGVLTMLRDGGLLKTADTAAARLNRQLTEATAPARTRVFIITCDRPAAVERLLQSMLLAGSMSEHEELFLIDDSRDEANAERNREAAAGFNITSPRDLRYVGPAQQRKLLDELVSALPDNESAIRFLIDRQRWQGFKTYGLSRSLCLLLSVNRRAIVMDDDTVCAAVDAPHSAPGLTFGDTPREVDFYNSQQDIVARTTKADFNPLTGHATCLGLPLAQAVTTLAPNGVSAGDLAGCNADYLGQWDGDSPIIMTQNGTLGDPGTARNSWIYTLDPTSAQRLLQSPGGLDAALINRHYWMGQTRPQFSKMAVISQVTGLDNTRLLPPYFPVFRGEDYLFGAMVEYMHPQAAILTYDWCVPHFPLEERTGDLDTPPTSGKGLINPSKYITDHTRYERGPGEQTRLQQLALMIQGLSETSDQGLLSLYRKEVAEAQGKEISRLDALLQNTIQRPERWNNFLQNSINATGESLQVPAQLEDIPTIPDGYNAEQILAEFRAYTAELASALLAWPEIRRAAEPITRKLIGAGDLAP